MNLIVSINTSSRSIFDLLTTFEPYAQTKWWKFKQFRSILIIFQDHGTANTDRCFFCFWEYELDHRVPSTLPRNCCNLTTLSFYFCSLLFPKGTFFFHQITIVRYADVECRALRWYTVSSLYVRERRKRWRRKRRRTRHQKGKQRSKLIAQGSQAEPIA